MDSSVLWVYAHPDPASFSRRLREGAIAHLREHGTEVTVSDLYESEWNPVLSDADFPGATAASFSERQKQATESGRQADDITREQQRLRDAGVVVVQFPLWWYGMPAILKGWFDRVLANGFAFGVTDAAGRVRKYGDGGLVGRRLLPIVTAGDRESALGPRGISGCLEDVLWPLLHGTAHYTGMAALRPHLIASADRIDPAREAAEQTRLAHRLDGVTDEAPLPYRLLRGGDYDDDHVLVPGLADGKDGFGAHLARS